MSARSQSIRLVANSQQFDLKRVRNLLQSCYDDNYDLNTYVEIYEELNKIFKSFGRGFAFVASELDEKTSVLKNLLESNSSLSYQKVESMLNFELENNLTTVEETKKTPVRYESGARALSRLHRALDFVLEIFDAVPKSNDDDSVTTLVKNAYDGTLAKFHGWALRKAVYVAVYTLPNREKLIADLAGPRLTKEESFVVMQEIVKVGRRLYNGVQKLYADRDMLDLP